MNHFGYLLLSVLIAIPWFHIYISRPDLRSIMKKMGAYGGGFGILIEYWYYYDYWNPPILIRHFLIEDFIFGFFISGITFTIYDFVFNKKNYKKFDNNKNFTRRLFFAGVICMLIFTNYLRINSIYVSSFLFLFFSCIIFFKRPDLIFPSVMTGILVLLIILPIYIYVFNFLLPDFWHLSLKLTRLGNIYFIFNTIPISEFLWYFAWGLLGGSLYNFRSGLVKLSL